MNNMTVHTIFKRLFTCMVLLFVLLNAKAQHRDSVYLFSYFKGNGDGLHFAYSHDGFNWQALANDQIVLKPNAGKDKLMRDPCIIRGKDGLFHMVWTVSWNEKGIGYASSKDLVTWSEQQYLPVMEHEPEARNTWAPEITFDPQTNQYYIYWATTIDGRFSLKDTAAESKYNHRMYYTSTADFKTFTPTKLLLDPGFSIIDASIIPLSDRYLMFLKNETRAPEEKNIRVAFAQKIEGPYSEPSAPIHGKYWAEGPTALFIGNKWVVYFDKYRDHKYGAVTSADLVNWTDVSNQLKMPDGLRHGTAFVVSKKEFETLQAALERRK